MSMLQTVKITKPNVLVGDRCCTENEVLEVPDWRAKTLIDRKAAVRVFANAPRTDPASTAVEVETAMLPGAPSKAAKRV